MNQAQPSRCFTWQDQERFAELSGDYSPIHVDSDYARQAMFGEVIVHGIHALLWALDQYAQGQEPFRFKVIKVSFILPIKLGETVSLSFDNEADTSTVNIHLSVLGKTVVKIFMQYERGKPSDLENDVDAKLPEKTECEHLSFDQASVCSGALKASLNTVHARKLFPHLMKIGSHSQIAELTTTTVIVGMRCPGLNSLYAKLNLQFTEKSKDAQDLRYQVTNANQKFSVIEIAVEGSTLSGILTVYFRPSK